MSEPPAARGREARPPRRGLIGPFTARHLLVAAASLLLVGLGLAFVTAPIDAPRATTPPVNASFFPVASPIAGLQPGDRAPELTGTVPATAPDRAPGVALLVLGAAGLVAGGAAARRSRRAGRAAAAVGLLVVLGSAPLLLAPAPPAQTAGLTDLDGHPIRLADFRGRPVWLDFWASWCPPCQAETPTLQKVYLTHRDQGLALIAISVQETSPDDVRAYAERYRLAYLIGFDATSAVFRTYQAWGLPTQVFIDRDGIVRSVVRGPVSELEAEQQLAPLLGTHGGPASSSPGPAP